MKIEGCRALVTGGNRGIGEGFVLELLEAGAARVYVGARTKANAEPLRDQAPDRIEIVELDTTIGDQVEAAALQCADVNLLINNAGVFRNTTLMGAENMAALREEIEVNYLGSMAMCRAFAPVIESQGGGAIVNVLSAGAIVAVPDMGGYSPSKFAMRAASDCMRAELAPRGIFVSALIVGSVKTRMAEHVQGVFQEEPRTIAKAGLTAAQYSIPEHDTDDFAIGVRAALARDPGTLAKNLARGVQAKAKTATKG